MSSNINFFFVIKDFDPALEENVLTAAREFIAADEDWSVQAEITFAVYEYESLLPWVRKLKWSKVGRMIWNLISRTGGKIGSKSGNMIVGSPRYALATRISRVDGWLPDVIKNWKKTICEANGTDCPATIKWDSDDEPCFGSKRGYLECLLRN